MPALFDDSILDAALAVIRGATVLHICSGTPTTRSEVLAQSLANTALTSAQYGSTVDGTPNGRALTVAARPGIAVTASGTPAHYCLIDGTKLVARTEVNPASPNLTQGSTVDIPAVTFSVADPTVVTS